MSDPSDAAAAAAVDAEVAAAASVDPSASPDAVAGAINAAQKLGEELDIETFLGFWPSMLLLLSAGVALSLTVYYFMMLSDLTDDLINPYTLCDRVNGKIHIEFAAHAAAVVAILFSLHPYLVILSIPGLALRALWWRQKKLIIDATTCYNSKVQSGLRTRWGVLCMVHGITVLLAFVQVLLHGVLAIHSHEGMRNHMSKMGEMHMRHGMHGMGMHGHMHAGLGLHHF